MKFNQLKNNLLAMLIISVMLLTACFTKPNNETIASPVNNMTHEIAEALVTSSPTLQPTPSPTVVPTATPRSGPDVIGIYIAVSGGRQLLTEYESQFKRGTDIATFNAFASNEPLLNYAPYREMLVDKWFAFPNAADYKIGYQLNYTLVSGEKITVTIKKPSDITHTEYLEVYLYDSVQQYARSKWYSHLEDDIVDDETILYSFKLTPGVKIKEVESIRLKAFVYKYFDESDFDPNTGEYSGSISYEIDIIEK